MKLTRAKADRFLLWFALAQLLVSVIGWPVTALTLARDEPRFVLGLSWFAIIQNALVFVVTALIRQDGDSGGD